MSAAADAVRQIDLVLEDVEPVAAWMGGVGFVGDLLRALRSARAALVVDREADERARIVWWLRAACDGPGAVTMGPIYCRVVQDMAHAIEQHPERFADAPTGRSGEEAGRCFETPGTHDSTCRLGERTS